MAKNEHSIEPAQLLRMLSRYEATIAAWLRMNAGAPAQGADKVERAESACQAAAAMIRAGELGDARHLVGLVQGVLLCCGIHTWEYLASDDARD